MATIPVGPGETYTSIAAALTAESAADLVIELTGDIIESVVIVSPMNFLEIRSDSTRRTWGGSSTSDTLITTSSTPTHAQTISNIDLINAGGARVVALTVGGGSVSHSITLSECSLTHLWSQAHDDIARTTCYGSEKVIFDKCEFVAHVSTYRICEIYRSDANNTVFKNCIARGFTGGQVQTFAAIHSRVAETYKVYTAINCTFYEFNRPVFSGNTDATIQNCLMMGAGVVSEYSAGAGNLPKSSLVNCAFQVQTDDGGWDATTKFGINPLTEVTDAAGADFTLTASSTSVDAGTDTSAEGVTTDYIGTSRPQGSAYDIGAYEFIVVDTGPLNLGGFVLIIPPGPLVDPSIVAFYEMNTATLYNSITESVDATQNGDINFNETPQLYHGNYWMKVWPESGASDNIFYDVDLFKTESAGTIEFVFYTEWSNGLGAVEMLGVSLGGGRILEPNWWSAQRMPLVVVNGTQYLGAAWALNWSQRYYGLLSWNGIDTTIMKHYSINASDELSLVSTITAPQTPNTAVATQAFSFTSWNGNDNFHGSLGAIKVSNTYKTEPSF